MQEVWLVEPIITINWNVTCLQAENGEKRTEVGSGPMKIGRHTTSKDARPRSRVELLVPLPSLPGRTPTALLRSAHKRLKFDVS